MNRSVKSHPMHDNVTRWMVKIEDDPVDFSQIRFRQFALLKELAVDGPYSGILACGPVQFDKMQMYFNHATSQWIVELTGDQHV